MWDTLSFEGGETTVSENQSNLDGLKALPTNRGACWIGKQEHSDDFLNGYVDT
jgi:hypothetical protein